MTNDPLQGLYSVAATLEASGQIQPELLDQVKQLTAAVEQHCQRWERECLQLQDQLGQATRLAELGLMAASVFHEMNQPLLGIKGFVELAQEHLRKGQTAKLPDWLAEIHHQTVRMHDMQKNINEFLLRKDTGQQHASLDSVLAHALSLFEDRLRKGKVALHQALPADLPGVDIPPQQLAQILINLLANALQAMEFVPQGALFLSASYLPESDFVSLVIANQGVPIPDELRDRIFAPFFTTKGDKGTGLGLYIARRLANASQGSLILKTPASEGPLAPFPTVFELRLPAAKAVGSQEPQVLTSVPAEPQVLTPAQRLQALNERLMDFTTRLAVDHRILLVENDTQAIGILQEYVAAQNIRLDAEVTAEDALERLNQDQYAAVLTALDLPGMTGLELIAQILQIRPGTPILVIADSSDPKRVQQALASGAEDHLPKPFPSLPFVYDKIRGALARYDFDFRVQAMVDFLCVELKQRLGQLDESAQGDWIARYLSCLSAYQGAESQSAHILALAPVALLKSIERLGHRVTAIASLEQAESVLHEQPVHVAVFIEDEHGLDSVSAIRFLRSINPDVGVFVIARENNLKQVVDAIGIGAGDYLLRPIEGRELFPLRLNHLVARQQHILGMRRQLESLKQLHVELSVALAVCT